MESNLWIAKEDAVLRHFMKTPIWNELLSLPNLMFIYVGGSHFYNGLYEDSNSDYDILVVVDKNDTYISPTRFMKIDGKLLHWTIKSINTYSKSLVLTHKLDRIWALYAGMVKFNRFERNLLLYENPKYSLVVDTLIKIRSKIQLLHFHKYVLALDDIIQPKVFYYKPTDLYEYPKCFYHIFAAYKDLTGFGEIDWIKQIKAETLTSNEEIAQIYSMFKAVVAWCQNNPIDIEKLEDELYEYFFDKDQKLIL